jgi:acyl phosphate:glycerol-3-phosphate acyltransferase
MSTLQIVLTCIAAYIAGSIPTAVWAGKLFHGIDIREHGSGNAGATNTIRVLGWKTGVPVLLIDAFKGWLAASLPVFIGSPDMEPATLINYQIIAGLIAIAGHIFPVFAGFRGGKGVATTFGFLLALALPVTIICLGVFLAVLFISGYVSLSSMAAGLTFPLLIFTIYDSPSILFRAFSVLIAIALVATHQKNIVRLINGEEKKFIRKKN